ncbi:MAG: dioxygenase [Planctomycetales bacterium]|nr:dioxygenase [Planctomycetales bacterium]
MDRREFLKAAGAGVIGAEAAALLGCSSREPEPAARGRREEPVSNPRMPVLFTAHGSPMNAVEKNRFTEFLEGWPRQFPRPRAILCVSAHWETPELAATTSPRPETVHDFWNFPEELYRIRYPAPGDPALAEKVVGLLRGAGLFAHEDGTRGLDHGTWSPLRRVYPEADVPVVQLSLSTGVPGSRHVQAGQALASLRDEGILILGSGNLVHNLLAARLSDPSGEPEGWAETFDDWVRERTLAWDLDALAAVEKAPFGRESHPTAEHYWPLLVCAGAAAGPSGARAKVSFPHEGFAGRTISMRCVAFA